MRRYSHTSPLFVRQFNDGQASLSTWDCPVRAFAEANDLPRDRLKDAFRILNFYYPKECRRAWSCLDDTHGAARARHAQALAEFELGFNSIGSATRCENAIDRIAWYLRKGRLGDWLWEALVEEVESIARLTAGGKRRVARWFACGALRAYYPYIGGEEYWAEIPLDYDGHARHVLGLVRFEYEFTRDHHDGNELKPELRIAKRFASRVQDVNVRQMCTKILNGKPSAYSPGSVLDVTGVYARFREPNDAVPMYVGMGDVRSAMAKRHSRYSGSHPMYIKYFEDSDFKTTEKILLAVFDPPENSHHWNSTQWIKHPDELRGWFVAETK